jgi:hypothetical protein
MNPVIISDAAPRLRAAVSRVRAESVSIRPRVRDAHGARGRDQRNAGYVRFICCPPLSPSIKGRPRMIFEDFPDAAVRRHASGAL